MADVLLKNTRSSLKILQNAPEASGHVMPSAI